MKFEGFSTENRHLAQIMTTTADDFITDIFKTRTERCTYLGLGLSAGNIMPVYFVALTGVPAEEKLTDYKNSLYKLRDDLIKSPKFLIFIQDKMRNPTPEEINFFDAVSRGNADETVSDFVGLININGDSVRTEEAKRIFSEMAEPLKKEGSDILFDFGAKTITWLNRCTISNEYAKFCEADIPVVIFYGKTSLSELSFMHFLSRIGFDVIYISSERGMVSSINTNNAEGRMQIFEFPYEMPQFPYPDKLTKTSLATTAYSAEQELNEFMYSNTSIFKDFQFSDMQSLTLKTTYEEIDILWHQKARYRAGFNVIEGKKVIVPNIFAKINGIKDGDTDGYWDSIREKLSPLTKIMLKSPSYDKFPQSIYTVYNNFFSGTEIYIDKLKKSSLNPYNYLSDSLQLLIFNKIQEAIDSGWLLIDPAELVPLVLYVGLNIDKSMLKTLQKYDYTKDIPKIILIDTIEDTFSKVECIQLVLFNLLGFDILVYTPTGYKNLETYISPSAFETYTMNEYIYNIRIPRFKIPDSVPEPKNSDGFFNKLFRKGRK